MSEEIKYQDEDAAMRGGEDKERLEAGASERKREVADLYQELETDEPDEGVVIHDADAEDALEEARVRAESEKDANVASSSSSNEEEATPSVRSMAEMMAIIEALIFVSE